MPHPASFVRVLPDVSRWRSHAWALWPAAPLTGVPFLTNNILQAYAGRLLGMHFWEIGNYLGIITWVILGGTLVWYVVRVIQLKRKG